MMLKFYKIVKKNFYKDIKICEYNILVEEFILGMYNLIWKFFF